MTMPTAWVALLASLAERYDVGPDQLLSERLKREDLADPDARISLALFIELVERARSLTGEPGIGILLGRETRATLWGPVGFATLSAPTIRAAVHIAVRFCSVVTPAIALHLREERGRAEIVLDERADFGPARDVLLFWLLLGMRHVGKVMTGSASVSRLELTIPEPPYYARLRHELPATRFGLPRNRLLVPTSRLDSPYLLHDPAAMRMALELCKRQRDVLGVGDSFVSRVRGILVANHRRFPKLHEVASQLHVSSRTLTRRLAQEDTTFQALLEDERRQQARVLVLSRGRSLSEVATQLGYSNVANFERAFRRWEGRSPRQYREVHRAAGFTEKGYTEAVSTSDA